MARLILLKEDFGAMALYLTDLENDQLKSIVEQLIANADNGVGEDAEEIAKRFYPENILTGLGDTGSSKTDIITELDHKIIAECDYLGFYEVKQ